MKYCENCGAELGEEAKFCGDCGSPQTVDDGTEERSLVPLNLPAQQEDGNQNLMELSTGKDRKAKSIIMRILLVILLMAVVVGVGMLCWKMEVFNFKEQLVDKEKEQVIDQDNLYKTLDWQEDQDKTYALKQSLIEGNSDGTIQDIFEESAYFTPNEYMCATDGSTQYYLISCDYSDDYEDGSYELIFEVNEDEHLELVELYKNKKKVKEKEFEDFFWNLYVTIEDVQSYEPQEEQENSLEYFEDSTYVDDNGSYFSIHSADEDSVVAVMGHPSGDEIAVNMYFNEYYAEENAYSFVYDDYDDRYYELTLYPDDLSVIMLYWDDGDYQSTEEYYLE